jgi:hypothetical protein
MTDTTQHPAIVPDALVKAAEEVQAQLNDGGVTEWVAMRLAAALSLPRRTEADIRADERERLAKLAVEQDRGTIPPVGSSRPSNALIAACWLRSQGGEDE